MLPLPLYLLRVLDLTESIAGGHATRVLADMGAEVIKVEPPGGTGRQIQADYFASLHRNKLSFSIDFNLAAGRDPIGKLVKVSNLVVVDDGGKDFPGGRIDAESVLLANPGASLISIDSKGSPDDGIAAAGAALVALFHHRASGEGQEAVVEARSPDRSQSGNRMIGDAGDAGDASQRTSSSGSLENLSLDAVVSDQQLKKRGFFEPVAMSDGEQRLLDGSPYRFSGSPSLVRLPAPGLGEHNAYVLAEVLGWSTEEVQALGLG